VGTGTPDSCTAAAFVQAASNGGVVVFDCGAAPVTITLTQTVNLPTDKDTVIDGGGLVTLDGGDSVQMLRWDHQDFRTNTNTLTLQRITLQNGRAPATDYTDDPQDGCAWGYRDGQGGALYVRDGMVELIETRFENNHAADVGPDTGGGAAYVVASLGVSVVGSAFVDNDGSNGGALGFLQTTARLYNSRFEGNDALGVGGNQVQGGCPNFNHDEQGGAGGNGGALANDGTEMSELYFCGIEFVNNSCNNLGGAVFRTPNAARQDTTFEWCTITGNSSAAGAGALYISNSYFTLENSLVANNSAVGLGGAVRTELNTEMNIVNTTFTGNSTGNLAGALSYSGTGEIRNCTFADNTANGGPGLFAAAIRGDGGSIHNTIFQDNLTMDLGSPMTCWFTPHPGANVFQWPQQKPNSSNDDTACINGVTWQSAMLGPLQDNGGPTQTMVPGEVAVVGSGADCPATDQRGEPRPAQGCTLGAVEVGN